jgi:alkylhydroperoxidase/carboxymuconolactone decarboxylase family protein YurZ
LLQQLLALNPRAIKLKVDEAKAEARMKAAVATKNPALITADKLHLLHIQMQRRMLDIKQKQLVQQSNLLLLRAHQRTKTDLRTALSQGLPTFNYLKIESEQSSSHAPKLAVHPESSDVAPTYRTLENFDDNQALAHSWQYRLRVRSLFQNFLMADLKWAPSCAVTLKQDGNSWIPKIKKVKSWSKLF